MLTNFRSYQLAVQLHTLCRAAPIPHYLKDQLLRAAASIVLNLSEGSARATAKDRARFYNIAFASCREVQAVIDLTSELTDLRQPADHLAGCLYKLTRSR